MLVRFFGGPLDAEIYAVDVTPQEVYYLPPGVPEDIDLDFGCIVPRATLRYHWNVYRLSDTPQEATHYIWAGERDTVTVHPPGDELIHIT